MEHKYVISITTDEDQDTITRELVNLFQGYADEGGSLVMMRPLEEESKPSET